MKTKQTNLNKFLGKADESSDDSDSSFSGESLTLPGLRERASPEVC